MKNIKIALASLGIAAFLFVISLGVRGLIVNIKINDPIYPFYTDFAKDPGSYKNYMVRVDSVYVRSAKGLKQTKDFVILPLDILGSGIENNKKGPYRFFLKTDISTNPVVLGTDSGQTVSGILRTFRKNDANGDVDASLVAEDAYIIDAYSEPRAWYWNILLILVPQIFIYLLANYMYLLVKKKS